MSKMTNHEAIIQATWGDSVIVGKPFLFKVCRPGS